MAVTYGGQGKNEFGYNYPLLPAGKQDTRPFSIVYNKDTNVSQIYVNTGNNIFGVPQFAPVGTINFNTGKRTLVPSTTLSYPEQLAFKYDEDWDDRTKLVIADAAPSQNPDQLLQPRGTQSAPATPAGAQAPVTTPGSAAAGPGGEELSETTDALQPLDFGEDTFKSYAYPLNYNQGQDRIHFYQLQYLRTGVIQTETEIKNYKKLSGSVTLPMPNDITETNSVGWGEDSLSNAAALLMGPLTQGAQIITSGEKFGQLPDVGTKLANVLKRNDVGMRVQQTLVARAAAGLVGKFGIQVNPEAFITRSTGAAINPNLELLFNGPKLRQFGFQFKMTPRDEKEARQIRGIIRFFKKGMSPRRSTNQDLSFFLGTPNIFKIKFVSGNDNNELKSVGKIKTCALVSFSANYTPDGFYAAYSDSVVGSQPIAVTIQLGFTELTPVFSDEYGDDDNDIGPNSFDKDFNVLNLNTSTAADDSARVRGAVQGPAADGSGRTLQEQQALRRTAEAAASPDAGGRL